MDVCFFRFYARIIDKIKKTFFAEFFEGSDVLGCVGTFFYEKADGPPASEDDKMLIGKIGYLSKGLYPGGQEPYFLTGRRKDIHGHAGYSLVGKPA